MSAEPRCDAVTAALAANEPADPAHLATCAACRARAGLVRALHAVPAAAPLPRAFPAPRAAALGAAVRQRTVRRVAFTAAAIGAVAALVVGFAPAPDPGGGPAAKVAAARVAAAGTVDLVGLLDEIDRPADTIPGEELLALLDPGDEDPLAALVPLEAALLGEGSL